MPDDRSEFVEYGMSVLKIAIRSVSTPFGWACVAATSEGLLACSWPCPEGILSEKALKCYLPEALRAPKIEFVLKFWGEPDLERMLGEAERALKAYFNGDLHQIGKVPKDMRFLTPWQLKVYGVVAGIPAGEIRSYGWVAERCKKEGSARAVGRALSSNPLPLFIPCHRVVYGDGRTGSYRFGGSGVKKALLFYEQRGGEIQCGNGTAGFRV